MRIVVSSRQRLDEQLGPRLQTTSNPSAHARGKGGG